jgi:two-component system chemotaxis response regulator CheB
MARYPRPVVMLSTLTQEGAATTLRALAMGAVDFLPKPSGSVSLDFHRVRDELLAKIRAAASAKLQPTPRPSGARDSSGAQAAASPSEARKPKVLASPGIFERLVVIGSSTGGPRALGLLVPALPRDGRTAYLVIQHMPAGFTRSFAERLDTTTDLEVREATADDRLTADTVLVAPGDHHIRVTHLAEVRLDQGPRLHGVRPAIDIALESVATCFARRSTVAILTGMGQDGAAGAEAVRRAGGYVLAEDESSCVVWGMPRAVVERNAADAVVPLEGMAEAILARTGARAAGAR